MGESFMGCCETKLIVKSFKEYGISNALDGAEDHLLFEDSTCDVEEILSICLSDYQFTFIAIKGNKTFFLKNQYRKWDVSYKPVHLLF